jgi:hypothetical protein
MAEVRIMKLVKRKQPNVRQQLYKKYRFEGMNAYQAALKAGYSKNTAINATYAIEKNLNLGHLLIKMGLDDDKIVRVLTDGLQANKVILARDGTIDVPDHRTRHFYLETLLRLRGDLREQVINQSLTQVVIVREEKVKVIDGNQSPEERLPRQIPLLPK